MEDFEKELKLGFLEEAEQLLDDVEQNYLQLEQDPNDSTIIDKIFRVAHNIKGSSRAVGFSDLGQFAHVFENLLLKIKEKTIEPNELIINLLLRCNDHLHNMVLSLKEDMSFTLNSDEIIADIQSALEGNLANQTPPSADLFNEDDHDETLSETSKSNDVNTNTFDKHLTAATEDVLTNSDFEINKPVELAPEVKIPLGAMASENITSHPVASKPESTQTSKSNSGLSDESIRVSLNRLEKLLDYVGEMVVLQTVLKEQTHNSSILIRKTVHQLGKATKEVQEISMGLRMLPIKQTFSKMQRIVRDTSSELGKKVKLVLEGEETEIDKTILERISDPLVHLVRNACDHGIESPEKRLAAGKDETGIINLKSYHQSGKLVIEISDDGGGINSEFLKNKAIEKKIIPQNANLSEREALNLIFHPGFSTKTVVTDVSGRGVGMDVVKSNISAIQGDILLDTSVGKGTTFKIILPLTLAIIDAMVVLHNEHRYVIPLSHIHESVKLDSSDIKKTTGLGDILLLRGENIPIYYLNDLFNKRITNKADTSNSIAIIIKNNHETFAVIVDDIIGQYQVVIKKLGDEIHGIRGISGSAILGDGKPSLILELSDLINKNKKNSRNDLRGVAI